MLQACILRLTLFVTLHKLLLASDLQIRIYLKKLLNTNINIYLEMFIIHKSCQLMMSHLC